MSVIYRCELGAFLSNLGSEQVFLFSNNQLEDSIQHHNGDDAINDDCERRERDDTGACKTLSTPNRESGRQRCYRWNGDLFAVYTPFMMDSQVDRIKREATLTDSVDVVKETSAQRKRRKKSRNKLVLSESEKKASEVISQTLPGLVETARELHYLDELPSSSPLCSNNAARTAAQVDGCGSLFQDLCCDSNEKCCESSDMIVLDGDVLSFRATSILGRRVCNMEDIAKTIKVDTYQFIIPPLSSFLTSSFHDFVTAGYTQLQVKDGYDLIVIDPPWNNKSVKRKKSYHMVQETDLKQIPVLDLAGRNCLVCVWITNNDRLKSFVKEELFPHWSVDFLAEWFWMKVTRHGEPVCDILSPHKKPYEKLLIGRFKKPVLKVSKTDVGDHVPCSEAVSFTDVAEKEYKSLQSTSSHCKSHVGRISEEEIQCIPKDFVLASVPCSLHSKKPSLGDVLLQYLPSSPDCLELFARNLTPGWVSWGNEPLLHQHLDYFEQVH